MVDGNVLPHHRRLLHTLIGAAAAAAGRGGGYMGRLASTLSVCVLISIENFIHVKPGEQCTQRERERETGTQPRMPCRHTCTYAHAHKRGGARARACVKLTLLALIKKYHDEKTTFGGFELVIILPSCVCGPIEATCLRACRSLCNKAVNNTWFNPMCWYM